MINISIFNTCITLKMLISDIVYRETARSPNWHLRQTLKVITDLIFPSFGNFRGKFCRVPASYSLTLGWIPISRKVDKGAIDAVKFASRIHYVNHRPLKSGYLRAVFRLPRLNLEPHDSLDQSKRRTLNMNRHLN